MIYNFYFDIAAMIIMAVLIIFFYEKNLIKTRFSRMFEILLWIAFSCDVFDFITAITVVDANVIPRWMNHVVIVFYFLTIMLVPAFFGVYFIIYLKSGHKLDNKVKILYSLPYALVGLVVVSSPFTGLIYYFDENGVYCRGPINWIAYAGTMIYGVIVVVNTVRCRKRIEGDQKFAIGFSLLSVAMASLVYFLAPTWQIVPFFMTVSMWMLYMVFEHNTNFVSRRLQILNENAFETKVEMLIEESRDYEILGIHINGVDYLSTTIGKDNANDLMRVIAEQLEIVFEGNQLFYIGGNRFAILSTRLGVNWDLLIRVLQKRFRDSIEYGNIAISIDAALAIIPGSVLRNLEKYDDVMHLVARAVADANESTKGAVITATEKTLLKSKRETDILRILKGAVREQQFEVYYQPIYSIEKKRFTSAEALVRLKDDTIGYISPEEFIPIAEKNGLILEIGEFVFRSVCRCIVENKICERGIDFIEVNLSVVQCMQEKLYEQLVAIMDEFKMPYHYVNMEITESTAVMSQDTLQINMEQLIARDIHFALDDYGTGFSNMMRIVEYPFSTIKLDKSLLWTSMENPKAMHALRHTILMIKEMGLASICEGVENFAQADLLEKMGCDYLQGYYFSKPVRTQDFLEMLQRDQAVELLSE